MDDFLIRLPYVVNVIVPLLLFTASIYLALHIVFARLITNPGSPTLWFFAVVTRPLTSPIRALLPPATPERRVRWVSLGVYIVLWIVARVALARWLTMSVP